MAKPQPIFWSADNYLMDMHPRFQKFSLFSLFIDPFSIIIKSGVENRRRPKEDKKMLLIDP